jgi:hypothetical protein
MRSTGCACDGPNHRIVRIPDDFGVEYPSIPEVDSEITTRARRPRALPVSIADAGRSARATWIRLERTVNKK